MTRINTDEEWGKGTGAQWHKVREKNVCKNNGGRTFPVCVR